MPNITVLKLNIRGEVTWKYDGRVVSRKPHSVLLEAFFNRPDMPFLDLLLRQGDRFLETFYADRWYNVFEIHDRADDYLKGWYCNISRPAVIADASISYVDLALDLWISPDGRQSVLDEDEFADLDIQAEERARALAALAKLQEIWKAERPPL